MSKLRWFLETWLYNTGKIVLLLLALGVVVHLVKFMMWLSDKHPNFCFAAVILLISGAWALYETEKI